MIVLVESPMMGDLAPVMEPELLKQPLTVAW